MRFFRRYLIAGSLVALPVLISIYIFIAFFQFIDNILGRFINHYLLETYGYSIPGLGIILFVGIIFFAGFITTHLIRGKILQILERGFIKFPFMKQIYPATKQIVQFLFTDTKVTFKKSVLVEFPRQGIYTIGFITNEGFGDFNKKVGKELVNVLVPTVPNPLTGFLLFVPKDEVLILDISIEDALKMIISGGVINPKLSV